MIKGGTHLDYLAENQEKVKKGVKQSESSQDTSTGDSDYQPLSYFALFQYSTSNEKYGIAIAIFLAVINGCIPTIIAILYGEYCNMLVDRQFPTDAPSTKTQLLEWFGGGKILQNASQEARRLALEDDSIAWGLGCSVFTLIQFFISAVSIFMLNLIAAEQISRIQMLFFKAVICKDMAWFDTRLDGNFVGKSSENLNQLQSGIGGVIGIFVYLIVVFAFGVLIALIYGWELTLAILSTVPISIGTSLFIAKVQSKLVGKEVMAHALAAKIAEEVFTSIKTVVAFGGQKKEVERYSKNLEIAKKHGIKQGIASGIGSGILWFFIYSSYAIAFSYGIRLIQASREDGNEKYTPAVLLIVFFGIFTGLTNAGFASAHIETFARACGAAAPVYSVINSKTGINPCSNDGIVGYDCNGEIEFKNVYFEYPSRNEVKILKGLNLQIKGGETVAIVGGSGAGKSTVLQLIQRLYDPSKGEILLDGINIKSLKVSWLRQQLGVVGQEPTLFATTIRENIIYGNSAATEEEVIKSAKEANAHEFIMKQTEGYDTIIGQKGSTLSGGQKQRIAIARALIRNPKILLLDEATSALDAANENIVQAALDRASVGRTTIIVTHRLSTIEKAHRIIVLANGVVAEQGTHKELLNARGLYYNLYQTQGKNKIGRANDKAEVTSRQATDDEPAVNPVSPPTLSSTSLSQSPRKDVALERIDQYVRVNLQQILKWNKKEWVYLGTGSAASIIAGAALPVVCALFGNLFGLLSLADFDEILEGTNFYSIVLVVIGIIAGVCVFLQMYCFAFSEKGLTTRLRIKAFNSMLHQEIGWFDDDRNKVGALLLRLSQDASGLQGATGSRLGIMIQAFSTMTIATVLSFFFTWKMTLVTLATVPFVFSGVYVESIFIRGSKNEMDKSMEAISKIAIEVIGNIRAIACLGKEMHFVTKYETAIKEGRKNNLKRALLRGLAFAVGQTAPYFGYAISLWYGGYLVANENLMYKYVVMVSELLIFGAWTLGQCVVLAPSFHEAQTAAGRLQYIFTRKPKVYDGHLDEYPDLGRDGAIRYSNVNFVYPTKPDSIVLENFSATVRSGQSIAIMGPSGSGKSTIVQLLQRYYDPTSGRISINNVNIANYKLSCLRMRQGLVSQEPVLFDRTVEENIAYGSNSEIVTTDKIIEAARAANIHNFIVSLPQGYNTRLGVAGAQLSGGQKQRIAIARALVGDPQVLLLDEATSALDPESEYIVQEALDKASSGRTTITIAHRFGALKNADVIYVLEKGKIQEFGNHQTLMARKGLYFLMHDQKNFKEH